MKFIPLLLLVAASQLTHADVQFQGTAVELSATLPSLPRLATIQGSGEVRTHANRARVDLLVATENRSLDQALAENARLREQLVRALTSRGIAPEQIQNSEFASSQRHALFSDKVKSYRIENHVQVTVRNAGQLRNLARQLDAQPEAIVQGIEFDHTDDKALRRKAVEEALADATAQKAVYENSLAVKMTAKTFAEGPSAPVSEADYPGYGLPGSSASYNARPARAPAATAISGEPSFAFGELVFKAKVSVQYAVEANR